MPGKPGQKVTFLTDEEKERILNFHQLFTNIIANLSSPPFLFFNHINGLSISGSEDPKASLRGEVLGLANSKLCS